MSRDKWQSPGTGSVYEFEGQWFARMATDGFTKSGRPAFKKIRCKNRTEAVEALRKMTVEKDQGELTKTNPITLGGFLDKWLSETVKPHQEFKTYRTYEQHVRLYVKPKLGNARLTKLSPSQIQTWVNWLSREGKAGPDGTRVPLATKTVRDAKGVLSSALQAAVNLREIRTSPMAGIKAPKAADRQAIYLTATDAANLIETSREHNIGPLINLALSTGLRLGEATGLTWDDIDTDLGLIRVRRQLQRQNGQFVLKGLKTKSSTRTLSLPRGAVDALLEQRTRQMICKASMKEGETFNELRLVFTTTKGKPIDGPDVDDQLKGLCVSAKVPVVSFHKLRHTAATHLAAAGIPLNVVKDQLGHSQIATVNIYTHSVPAALKMAGDALGSIYLKSGASK